jgi:hypothetical protein
VLFLAVLLVVFFLGLALARLQLAELVKLVDAREFPRED